MPYDTELTEDCLGIVHVGSGVVTGEDLVAATQAATRLVQNTENFHYELVDWSQVAEVKITEEQLEEIVALDHFAAVFRPDAVVVIVAPRDNLFELAQKWDRRVQDLGWKTHISRERWEAIEWLRANLPVPRVQS